jgi:hypothetical protein
MTGERCQNLCGTASARALFCLFGFLSIGTLCSAIAADPLHETASVAAHCKRRAAELVAKEQARQRTCGCFATEVALQESLKGLNRAKDEALARCDNMSEEAAAFVKILDKAASAINPNKEPPSSQNTRHRNCSAFFKEVGRELGALDQGWPTGDANAIYIALINDKSGAWRELIGESAIELQTLVNKGAIIVGVRYSEPNGHVAIVSPVPPSLDLDDFGSFGPMIRDGNVFTDKHGRIYPKDWGTARASKAFEPAQQPRWFTWRKAPQ